MSKKSTEMGYFHRVYFEPMVGTGEKIVLAVFVVANENEPAKFQKTLEAGLFKCMFGKDGSYINYILEVIERSLQDCWGKNMSLDSWKIPIEGISIGRRINLSHRGDIEDAVNISLRVSSYFSQDL